jgi:hypothetical protein
MVLLNLLPFKLSQLNIFAVFLGQKEKVGRARDLARWNRARVLEHQKKGAPTQKSENL